VRGNATHLPADVENIVLGRRPVEGRALTASRHLILAHFKAAGIVHWRDAYGLASGAANISRQAAGICASVIGGFGFGGSGGGFGWSTESLNQ
jgi:hypothetical protein